MTKVQLFCTHCQAPFERAGYEHRHKQKRSSNTFCSAQCYRTSKVGAVKVERVQLTCVHCSQPFKRRRGYQEKLECERGVEQVFCSRKCHYESQRASLPERLIAEYESGLSLEKLGKAYGVSNSTIREFLLRNGCQTRSRTCAWTSEFCREQAYKSMTVKGQKPRVSKLEGVVASCLDELSIRYTAQKPIQGPNGRYIACVDFWIEDLGALEVNGTYWHCDPRAYPDGPVWPSQQRPATQHPAKIERLRKEGISIEEVWEIDIKADCFLAVSTAIQRLKLAFQEN